MSEQEIMDAVLAGPPPTFGGVLRDAAGKALDVLGITRAVVGQLKVKGLALGEILGVIAMVGYFIKEHGDDIEAIVKAVLALFGK